MTKLTSIPSRVLAILVVGALAIVIGFGFSLTQYLKVADRYRVMVDENTRIARLPITVSQTVRAFESFLLSRSPEAKLEFQERSATAKTLIQTMTIEGVRAHELREFSAFRRTLIGMFDYYRASAHSIMETDSFDSEVYLELSYLRILSDYMVLRAQQFVVSYLDATNVERQAFLGRFEVVQRRLAGAMIGILLLDILAVVILLRDLSSHLESVERAAKELSRGNWGIEDIEESRYRELSSVASALNEMKHNIVAFIGQVEEKAEQDRLLRETQLQALQGQINPHFLFNSLNMISRSAMFEETKTTISLVESIAQILRYSLENEGGSVPLSLELETVQSYVFIQKTRFGDRIRFQISTPKELQDILVPPMILQPLVENAIIHGLRDTRESGMVTIEVLQRESDVVVRVIDNGKGLSTRRLQEVLAGMHVEDTKRTSIGLHNVIRRLELAFQKKGLVTVASEEGRGTVVSIELPLEERVGT